MEKKFAERVKKITEQIKDEGGNIYNLIFGLNPNTPYILAALNLDLDKIGRFRDTWIEKDTIIVYTRLGANNGECCCKPEDVKKYPHPLDKKHASYCFVPNIRFLRKHPLYIADREHDEFDRTYRIFYFRIPEKYKDFLLKLEATRKKMAKKKTKKRHSN